MGKSQQVLALQRQQQDPMARSDLMQRLWARHRDQGTPFEVRPSGQRTMLTASSELLARTEWVDDDARRMIEEDGWSVTTVAGLRDRVLRIHKEGASRDEVSAFKERLEGAGIAVSLSYVTPNKIIDKSEATPEMARRREPTRVTRPDTTVQVVVLDTGINTSARDDGWLDGLSSSGNKDRLDVFQPLGRLDYAAGHGTFVAGIYRQVDPRLDLHVTRVLDTDGFATEVDVAVAVVAAVERHLKRRNGRLVLSLSLGTDTLYDEEPVALRVAVELIGEIQDRRKGEVMLVCAAGNEGMDVKCWPAAFAGDTWPKVEIVAVAALGLDGKPAGWSTKGRWVTCSAIGESVRSTFVRGVEDENIDPEPETFERNAWASWTGTSFAAPIVGAHVASMARRGGSLAAAREELFADSGVGSKPLYGTLLDLNLD